MTQAVNQTYADSSSSNQVSSNATTSNVATLVTAAASTTALIQAAMLNSILLNCLDIANMQTSDTNSTSNSSSNASAEETASTQQENDSSGENVTNTNNESLNQFFSEMDKLGQQETDNADKTNASTDNTGPANQPGSNPPAKVALMSYLYLIFEAMKNADASTGLRMIASGNSEIVLGTNITNMIYDAWTSNLTSTAMNCGGNGVMSGTGRGILGADENLFQNISNGGKNYSDWISPASTLMSVDSSTANTNEGTGQQDTQTWANQLSNDSQDEQGLLTTMVPDITGFGQQLAGYLATQLPA